MALTTSPIGGGRVAVRTPAGSTIVWPERPRADAGGGDQPETILEVVIARLRALNADPATKSRQISLAVTRCEEALHWLTADPGRERSDSA